jgi:hypothetical protein
MFFSFFLFFSKIYNNSRFARVTASLELLIQEKGYLHFSVMDCFQVKLFLEVNEEIWRLAEITALVQSKRQNYPGMYRF